MNTGFEKQILFWKNLVPTKKPRADKKKKNVYSSALP